MSKATLDIHVIVSKKTTSINKSKLYFNSILNIYANYFHLQLKYIKTLKKQM
jgi:hypothetical protein